MELKICWFYPELMSLYGDIGNIKTLQYRCEKRNINCIVDTCTFDEEKNLLDYDLLIISGACEGDEMIFKDLMKRRNDLDTYMKSEKFLLLLCGGFQMFGASYMDNDSNIHEGLNLLPYTSITPSRCIGDIILSVNLNGEETYVAGFENHLTLTSGITKPFGKVIHGNGAFEGYLDEYVLGTYLHGPLLPKNPKICDYIILQSLKSKGLTSLEKLDDTLEEKALEKVLKLHHVI